jgi:hypothetical protein
MVQGTWLQSLRIRDFVDVTAVQPIISDLPVSSAHLHLMERVRFCARNSLRKNKVA